MQLEGLVIPISFDTGLLLKGVSMITDLIKGAVTATFDWADGMDHLGDVTGMTMQQTAAWAFVAKKAGVEVDGMANSIVIMAKGLFDAKGNLSTTGKALTDFGVSVTDVNGNVKDQSTLMNEIAAKYASFATQTERVDFLTNIFGRSGANLVDVFDTLAQEGGIDKVEQKVKDLGLALDSGKYEQFTRQLNEIKLVATGLAAQFVDKLMPAAEQLLQWVADFERADAPSKIKMIEDAFNKLDLVGLSDKFKNWADSFDWAGLSQSIVDKLSNGDADNGIGQAAGKIIKNLAEGLNSAVTNTDWQGIGEGLSFQLANFITGLLAGKDLQGFIDESVNDLSNRIFQGLNLAASWQAKVAEWQAGISSSMAGVIIQVVVSIMSMRNQIEVALQEIKKVFYNSFQGAMQQAIQAINGMVSSVGKAISDFMTTMANIVGKGIAIGINVAIPNFSAIAQKIADGMALIKQALGGGGGNGLGAAGSGSGATFNGAAGGANGLTPSFNSLNAMPKKAAGGQAGGYTWVGENGPELVNLPAGSYVNNNQSSKKMANQPVQAYIDYDELARTMARVLGQQMQRA